MKIQGKILFLICLLFIALGLSGWAVVHYSSAYTRQQPEILFYSYGDSITTAGLDQNGNPYNYIHQMIAMYANGSMGDHSTDGGGMNTTWGVYNFDRHWITGTDVFVYMFINDAQYHLSYNQTAENYITIYHLAKKRGAIPIPCIPVLYHFPPCGAWCDLKNQTERITYLENALDSQGIPYLRMYDAIDSNPGNGIPDEPNSQYQTDMVHPNERGHRAMGEYLWTHRNGFNKPWHHEKNTGSVESLIMRLRS